MSAAAAILALALQCAPSIHPDTINDIALAESSYNPLAIGIVGENGIYPKNISDALAHVARLKSEGKNYSVGLMQINKSNFKKFNTTEEKLFNPCNNLRVFEQVLADCYVKGGTLDRALSCYYSGNFTTGIRPEKSFSDTSYVQRVRYVVPSTRQSEKAADAPYQQSTRTVYPNAVIRGVLPRSETQNLKVKYPTQVMRGNLMMDENKDIKG